MMEDGKIYQVEFRGHLYGIEKNGDYLEFFEFVSDNILSRTTPKEPHEFMYG